MAYRSSNPVFSNRNYAPSPAQLAQMYAEPTRLTIDDVVVHTGIQLGTLVVGAAIGWALTSNGNFGIALPAALIALGMSWFLAPRLVRTGRFGATFALPFAAIEGVFVGAVSKGYEDRWGGIVLQALLGTAAIFAVMLFLHRSGKVRATPRMFRVVGGTLLGVVVVSLVDFVLHLGGVSLPIVDGNGAFAILFTLAILVVASLQFTLDFAMVEQAIASGAPSKTAWWLGYGLMISFVWVYLELLRLLGQARR